MHICYNMSSFIFSNMCAYIWEFGRAGSGGGPPPVRCGIFGGSATGFAAGA